MQTHRGNWSLENSKNFSFRQEDWLVNKLWCVDSQDEGREESQIHPSASELAKEKKKTHPRSDAGTPQFLMAR